MADEFKDISLDDIKNEECRWYVVHTYSGYENKVKSTLDNIIETRNIRELIPEVIVPEMNETTTTKSGVRKEVTSKVFPSYVLVKMVMNDYCYLEKTQAILYEKTLNEMMGKISGFTGVNRRGNIFKLITALKQICNHPYQFLKSGGSSKELSGKAEKCVDLIQNIIENKEVSSRCFLWTISTRTDCYRR